MSAADGSVVSITGLSKVFGKGGVTALQEHRPRGRARRVRLADRTVGLRKVDAASHRRRHRRADRGRRHRQRKAGPQGAARPRLRDRVPGARPLRLAHRREEHRAAARDARVGPREACGARRGDARARRAHRVREAPPLAALGRDAAARLDRAGALLLARAPAHGRAVRRARRDDARAPQPGAAPHLGGDRLDGDLRHPLDLRGGVPVDARRRHVPAAGARSRASSRSTCRSRARRRRGRSRGSSSSSPRCASRCTQRAPTRSRRRSQRRARSREQLGIHVRPPSRRLGERVREWVPAVVVFALGLVAWQWLLPDVLGVEDFLLPRFSDVVERSDRRARPAPARRVDHPQGGRRWVRSRERRRDRRRRSSSPAGARSATR